MAEAKMRYVRDFLVNKPEPKDAKRKRINYGGKTFRNMYSDTELFSRIMEEQYPFYVDTLKAIENGHAEIELKKRYMLKAIDEEWVEKIEDCIPSLDLIIRKPSKFIQETEEVLPIELSRNISSRSIQHLSQHTGYISKVDGDDIIPSKILNVFRDETFLTYENKFVNTLIMRLYIFVSKRYETAVNEGKDEKTSSINFKENFVHGEANGKIELKIEVSEAPDEVENLKNYTFTTDLWQRVVKLNRVCTEYMNSEFVRNMNKVYIRPPVIRTNALLKNKDLHKCLELWEFIESYENIGYNMLVQETLEEVSERYVQALHQMTAIQYVLFRHNIKNDFEYDKTLNARMTDEVLTPTVHDEFEETFKVPRKGRYLEVEKNSKPIKIKKKGKNQRSKRKKSSEGVRMIRDAVYVSLATDKVKDDKSEYERFKAKEEKIAKTEENNG